MTVVCRPAAFQIFAADTGPAQVVNHLADEEQRARRLHGGNGYTEEYGLERLHHDAHGWAIAGGTPTMRRIRIVSKPLGRGFDQRR